MRELANLPCKQSVPFLLKLTIAALSDESMDYTTLYTHYGIKKIEDANIIIAAAKAFVGKHQGNIFPSATVDGMCTHAGYHGNL